MVEYSNPNLFNELLIFINKTDWNSTENIRVFSISAP